jgi:hypothetical protein
MTKHLFYRKQLPRDLIDTFNRNDQEMVRHLIGHDAFDLAQSLGCSFQFLLGSWDMNTQMVDIGIQIIGKPKDITIWLLSYQPKSVT